MNPELRQHLVDFLRQKNAKVTPRRMAIIEAAFESHEHFTAEQLLFWSRRRDARISRATVYRTLPLLLESGFLKEVYLNGEHLYDPNYSRRPDHSHLVCSDCGRIVEFDNDPIDRVVDIIAAGSGLRMTSKTLKVEATCRHLEEEGRCEYRPLVRASSPSLGLSGTR
ncbi:MAG: transcriptional repressor [Verrucomicrobiota bacterium]